MQNVLCIEDVKIGKKIGEGSFGEVYQAVWHGNVVAAKKTKRCDISNDLLSEYSVKIIYTHNKLILLLLLLLLSSPLLLFFIIIDVPPHKTPELRVFLRSVLRSGFDVHGHRAHAK